MRPPLVPDFARRLAEHQPRRVAAPADATWARSAVAAVVRPDGDDLRLLLMVRTLRAEDRWSGQVCLPGGRREPEDSGPVATARRETGEELGFDPDQVGALVGRLTPLRAQAQGGLLPLLIEPFVWLAERAVEPVLGPEAQDHLWLSLGAAARGEIQGELHLERDGGARVLPAWTVGDRLVWGLTHAMVSELLDVVAPGRNR